MYASSKTTMVRSGTRAMKRSTSSAVTIVAVGLLGFAMKTTFVIGVIARAIASRSRRWSFSITMTRAAPAALAVLGETADDGGGATAPSPIGRGAGRERVVIS